MMNAGTTRWLDLVVLAFAIPALVGWPAAAGALTAFEVSRAIATYIPVEERDLVAIPGSTGRLAATGSIGLIDPGRPARLVLVHGSDAVCDLDLLERNADSLDVAEVSRLASIVRPAMSGSPCEGRVAFVDDEPHLFIALRPSVRGPAGSWAGPGSVVPVQTLFLDQMTAAMAQALVAVSPRPARLVAIGPTRSAYVAADGAVRILFLRPERQPVDRAVCGDLAEPVATLLQRVGVPTDDTEALAHFTVFPPARVDPLAYVLAHEGITAC